MDDDYMTIDEFNQFSTQYVNTRTEQIVESIQNDRNVVCVGSSGCSKTYTVKHTIEKLIQYGVIDQSQYTIVSYVGVAAINANGRTINSTFMFPIKINEDNYKEQAENWARSAKSNKRYKSLRETLDNLKIIINDEFSVTSGIFMMFMDLALQLYFGNNLLFGGLLMICMGDPLQLLPIERIDGEPSLCTFVLDTFDVVKFDYGFRYIIKEDDKMRIKTQWFNFLCDLRYGILPENGDEILYNLGIKVITNLEYIRFEKQFGRLVMAQLNETVNKWNTGINKIYSARKTPIHTLDSIYYDISTKQKSGYVSLFTIKSTDLIKQIYKICIISGHIKIDSDTSQYEILEKISEASRETLYLDPIVKSLYVKELFCKRSKELQYNMSVDGQVPIVLPTTQQIRDQGIVMIRINKPSGHAELANGTVMILLEITNENCLLLLPDDGQQFRINRVVRYHYDMQGSKLTVCCQWPFIQADATTVTKSQGLTLNKAGYLLDERIPYFEMFHSQFVSLGRVKDPSDFVYIHSVDNSYGNVDDLLDPSVQQKRLRLAFPKIKKLIKVYKPILEKMKDLEQ